MCSSDLDVAAAGHALGALAVSSRGYILTNGRIRFTGEPKDIACDPLLREAFLGPAPEARP
mgnify:CR=1 FL=1